MSDDLELLDYRRRVAEMYAAARRSAEPPAMRWRAWRGARDQLFRDHRLSPVPADQRGSFDGVRYFAYDPALRFELPVDLDVEPQTLEVALEDDGLVRLRRFGQVRLAVADREVRLALFWLLGYGGGVFLPFRDATGGAETYGGGRYLLDTIKGADLGGNDGRLVLDFNFAYNPSCAYDARWSCPLAPPENWLPVPIRAGELRYAG